MDLKEKFAKKMLDEKLDFLPLEESLQLFEAGIELTTKFHHVCNKEELDEDGYETAREYVDACNEIYGSDRIEIGDDYDHFSEFTHSICPAPTYIDLIR